MTKGNHTFTCFSFDLFANNKLKKTQILSTTLSQIHVFDEFYGNKAFDLRPRPAHSMYPNRHLRTKQTQLKVLKIADKYCLVVK